MPLRSSIRLKFPRCSRHFHEVSSLHSRIAALFRDTWTHNHYFLWPFILWLQMFQRVSEFLEFWGPGLCFCHFPRSCSNSSTSAQQVWSTLETRQNLNIEYQQIYYPYLSLVFNYVSIATAGYYRWYLLQAAILFFGRRDIIRQLRCLHWRSHLDLEPPLSPNLPGASGVPKDPKAGWKTRFFFGSITTWATD